MTQIIFCCWSSVHSIVGVCVASVWWFIKCVHQWGHWYLWIYINIWYFPVPGCPQKWVGEVHNVPRGRNIHHDFSIFFTLWWNRETLKNIFFSFSSDKEPWCARRKWLLLLQPPVWRSPWIDKTCFLLFPHKYILFYLQLLVLLLLLFHSFLLCVSMINTCNTSWLLAGYLWHWKSREKKNKRHGV